MEALLPRSGTGGGAPPGPDIVNDVAALVTALLQEAIRCADCYRAAAGRRRVHPRDINIALMHVALPGSCFWLDAEMPRKVEDISVALAEQSSGEEEEEEEEGAGCEEWSQPPAGASDLADAMHRSEQQFSLWHPEDGIMRHIRDAVDEMSRGISSATR